MAWAKICLPVPVAPSINTVISLTWAAFWARASSASTSWEAVTNPSCSNVSWQGQRAGRALALIFVPVFPRRQEPRKIDPMRNRQADYKLFACRCGKIPYNLLARSCERSRTPKRIFGASATIEEIRELSRCPYFGVDTIDGSPFTVEAKGAYGKETPRRDRCAVAGGATGVRTMGQSATARGAAHQVRRNRFESTRAAHGEWQAGSFRLVVAGRQSVYSRLRPRHETRRRAVPALVEEAVRRAQGRLAFARGPG